MCCLSICIRIIQGRMALVNILSFLETAMIGLIALGTVPRFGTEAAWLANTWSDALAITIVLISVFLRKRKITLRIPDLLKLPDDFGASEEDCAEYEIRTANDVAAASEAVIAWCKSRHVDSKKAFLTGLLIEEMAGNVLQHGAPGGKHYHIHVRVVAGEDLTIRIRDDCRKFDPRERMQMYYPESPETNIGLRMAANLSTSIDYYNSAGIIPVQQT